MCWTEMKQNQQWVSRGPEASTQGDNNSFQTTLHTQARPTGAPPSRDGSSPSRKPSPTDPLTVSSPPSLACSVLGRTCSSRKPVGDPWASGQADTQAWPLNLPLGSFSGPSSPLPASFSPALNTKGRAAGRARLSPPGLAPGDWRPVSRSHRFTATCEFLLLFKDTQVSHLPQSPLAANGRCRPTPVLLLCHAWVQRLPL